MPAACDWRWRPDVYTTEVAEHLYRAAEGGLAIHHPALPVHSPQELIKLLWIRQGGSQPRTEDSFAPIEAFQTSAELATKHAAEDFHWQKERIAWTFPMAVVRRQPASWAGAVNIRMKQQILPPGMQNADQADLCARVFRVSRHLGLWVFAINTGLRIGEIQNLKWEEVELENGIIKMLVRKNRRMLEVPLTVTGAEKALPEGRA